MDLLKRLKREYLGRGFSTLSAILIIGITLSIIFFIGSKGIVLFTERGVSVLDFLFTNKWNPGAELPSFGAMSFILGSIFISVGAVIVSAPIGISVAIFIAIISKGTFGKIIKVALEILVGIPSVVYGWIGVTVLVPFIKNTYGGLGFSILAGVIVLSIMILPTIATLSVDAINSVQNDYIEASYGLGATRWQTIKKVIIPVSKNGILTGVVLGIARAFGEALAVQMVIGNTIKMPTSLLDSGATLTSVLTMDMANTVGGTAWNDAIWSIALVLLVVSLIFILIIKGISRKDGKDEF